MTLGGAVCAALAVAGRPFVEKSGEIIFPFRLK
jgi:hypothetical protein